MADPTSRSRLIEATMKLAVHVIVPIIDTHRVSICKCLNVSDLFSDPRLLSIETLRSTVVNAVDLS